jgi:hypothetical protein
MGWGSGVSEFCFFFLFFFFCQVWLQQESILFSLLKVFQSCLELVASGLAGRWWQLVVWLVGGHLGSGQVGL